MEDAIIIIKTTKQKVACIYNVQNVESIKLSCYNDKKNGEVENMREKNASALCSQGDRVGIVLAKDRRPINIKGGAKAKQAVKALSKFGLISFSKEQTFKSSLYSVHFIKPIANLKQLYNLGDEVLILCCNDSLQNFKSRTKDLIDILLGSQSEYRNRLDKITCFLVDDCEDIEDVIKRDRIDNPDSRLIIPFSYKELESGIKENDLQNRMRTFLYERDLFGVASPLRDDNLFFGKTRFNVISELYGKYLQGEHGGVFGLRRIGKTSILLLLRRRVEQNGGVAIYFDCTKYHHLTWNDFLNQIIQELRKKYTEGGEETAIGFISNDVEYNKDISRYTEKQASISFEEDLIQLHRLLHNKRILLIFDEVEQISFGTSSSLNWRDGTDALFFWQTLRSISQTDNNIFSFVITGVNPKCIEDAKICNQPNPIFNGLAPQYITLFDYDDVKNMVSEIGGHLGLKFEEEIFAKLVDDYGGHPFLIRQVCSKMNEEVLENKETRPFKISKYSYEKQSDNYQNKMKAAIEQILGVLVDYYPREYDLLKVLALDGSDIFKSELQFADCSIDHLLGYCLIKKEKDDYYIRIKAIEKHLQQKYKFDKTYSDISEIYSMVATRRCAIENKLRSLIGMQYALHYGKSAKRTLMDAIEKTTKDDTQKAKLECADLKGAMQELYFLQLKILIEKDWAWYERLFSDKTKFGYFSDVINKNRVDAHAKKPSDEDLFLLNLAFKYFEEALEAIS